MERWQTGAIKDFLRRERQNREASRLKVQVTSQIEIDLDEPLETYDAVGITMVTGEARQAVLVGQVVQNVTA